MHWNKLVLLGALAMGVAASPARAVEKQQLLAPAETLVIKIRSLEAANYTDGVGVNEFRLVARFRAYGKTNEGLEKPMSAANLGWSKQILLGTRDSIQDPQGGEIRVSAERLNYLYNYYSYYNADRAEIELVLEEVDPVVSETVAKTIVALERALDLRAEGGSYHRAMTAEVYDWAGEPQTVSYEVSVPDYTYMPTFDGNGNMTMVPIYAGSHQEIRYTVVGGGSKARAEIELRVE